MFEHIDDLITDWAKSHRVHWTRLSQDQEVRSIDLPLASGRIAQIWLEPAAGDAWKIRAWDRKHQNLSLTVARAELMQGLSDTLATVRSWAQA
jgi:hypothetical protein